MKALIKKILREEKGNRVMGSVKGFDGKQKTYHSWDPKIFFRIIKEIIDSVMSDKSLLDEMENESTWDRYDILKPTLNLFGITRDEFGWDADSLINKLFWAIKDNYDGIKDGTITNFNQLDLRPLQTFKAEMQENAVEHVTHYWSPILEAYATDDARSAIMNDDDGLYNYFEWDNEPGYERETGDYDSDGNEVTDVYRIDVGQKRGKVGNSLGLTESESPDENELIDGLRKILHKQKEAHSEDVWYDDIQHLFKKLNIPLEEQKKPLQEQFDKSLGKTPPEHKFDKVDNNIVKHIIKKFGCGEIDQMNRQGEAYVYNKLSETLKLYGRYESIEYEYYPKQLVQFIVDKGCPDEYTQFIGEELARINEYTVGMSYTETDTTRKTADAVIYDTNFQSAMCSAKEDFWQYEPDIYDSEVIDTDYYGDEEWDAITVNGTQKWIARGSDNDDNYDPTEVDC